MYLFESERASWGWDRKGRENPEADFLLIIERLVGFSLGTLRLKTELKSGGGHLPNRASQAPLGLCILDMFSQFFCYRGS